MNSRTLEEAANGVPAHALATVGSAAQELAGLLRQRAEIMRRIGTVKKMLAGMANLFGNSILTEELLIALDRRTSGRSKGFTPACRQVLMEAAAPLRTREACVELRQRFPQLVEHHKDLAASVTTVFHRLVEYGQARSFFDDHGIRLWEWATEEDRDRGVYVSGGGVAAASLVAATTPGLLPERLQHD
jgi:hypothetical protein